MSRNFSSLHNYKRIRIEGFEQQKLLSRCLSGNIMLRKLKIESDISMTAEILNEDWQEFLDLTKKAYRITILREYGYRPFLLWFLHRKATLAGLLIFFAILFYQANFIAEIRISGYERIEEAQIRQALAELGLYEGCSKDLDLTDVKTKMFQKLDDLTWIGITCKGSLAEVTIVEGTKELKKADRTTPVHIVAQKEGYIEKVIPREGLTMVKDGAFVKKGDIVISGIVPIEDKSYTNRTPEELIRLVHADGDVKARIIYRFHCYQSREEVVKKKTGKKYIGVRLQAGDLSLDTSTLYWPYKAAMRREETVVSLVRPIPFKLSLIEVSEVTQTKRERTKEEQETLGRIQARNFQKENIPESAEILNNSLKFTPKENIIEVTIMMQALEEIGGEQAFDYLPQQTGEQKPEEGT